MTFGGHFRPGCFASPSRSDSEGMLRFLLDEHIPKLVARLIRQWRAGIDVWAASEWRDGICLGKEDHEILSAAAPYRMALVTYDQKTITPLLIRWAAEERTHAGVILIDQRTIASHDSPAIARALIALYAEQQSNDWTNQTQHLKRAR